MLKNLEQILEQEQDLKTGPVESFEVALVVAKLRVLDRNMRDGIDRQFVHKCRLIVERLYKDGLAND